MSSGEIAEAVAKLVEIGESMCRRLDQVETRLSKLSGDVPEGFTFEEVAKLFKCHPKTVARKVASGAWGHFRVGSEKRIPKSEIVRITTAIFPRGSGSPGPLPPRRRGVAGRESEVAKIRALNKKRR